MKKAVLLVSLLPCFTIGAAAESPDVQATELATSGDANVVVIDNFGPVVTALRANGPGMTPDRLDQSGALKPTAPVMREGDALVREPLVARLLVAPTEPIPVDHLIAVPVTPAPMEDVE